MRRVIRQQSFRNVLSTAQGQHIRRPRTQARLIVFYLALLLSAAMTVLFLPDLLATLVTGWTASGATELGIHRLHVMGIATVVTVFLLGLFVQAYRPRKRVAAMWGAFVTILVASAGTVGFGVGRPEEVLPFLFLTGVVLLAHPAGRTVVKRAHPIHASMLALVAVAAIPVAVFVVGQYTLSTNLADPHAVDGHYVMMAALAVAPIAYGGAAALGYTGRRLAAWLAAIPMAYFGLLSIGFPAQTGSIGLGWGVAAILWAIALIVVAERVSPHYWPARGGREPTTAEETA